MNKLTVFTMAATWSGASRWLGAVLLVAASGPLAGCANGIDTGAEEVATAAEALVYDATAVGCRGMSYVNIKAGDYYCTAEGGGGDIMTCNRTAAGEWELFRVVNMGDNRVALETSDTVHYVCAEGGGGGALVANRTVPGAWESFRSVYVGAGAPVNFRSFQTDSGYYFVAEGGGGDVMNADRTAVGAWETFKVECVR